MSQAGARTRAVVLAVAVLVVALLTAAVAGAAGRSALDGGFGSGGRVLTSFGSVPQGSATIEDLALAPDGRIAVATEGGPSAPIQVAMLRPDGALETSFAESGILRPQLESGPPFRSGSSGSGTVRLAFAGSSLLVAGEASLNGEAVTEVREYGAGGGPVTSFGKDGRVVTRSAWGGGAPAAMFAEGDGRIALFAGSRAVLLGPSGALLSEATTTAGRFDRVVMGADGAFLAAASDHEEPFTAALLRFDADGQQTHRADFTESSPFFPRGIGLQAGGAALAARFEGGIVRFQADDQTPDPSFQGESAPCRAGASRGDYNQIVGLADGRILAAGFCGLVRLAEDGAPDPSFGSGGIVPLNLSAGRIAVEPGGKVLYATWNSAEHGVEVARLDEGGAPDPTFGAGGSAVVPLLSPVPVLARGVAAAPGGRVVAAGETSCEGECQGFALARYRANGKLDPSFGESGRVVVSRDDLHGADAVAVARNGGVFAVGATDYRDHPASGQSAEPEFALLKLRPDGRPDPRFGGGGVVTRQVGTASYRRSEPAAVALQANGRVVVGGLAGCRRKLCFTLARFLPDGRLDRSFAHDGVLRLREHGATATAVTVLRGGKIVATGGGYGYFVTVRLTASGRLDRSFGGDGVVARRQRIHFKTANHDVIDMSIGAKALAVGRGGSITVAGGSRSAHSVVERYLPNGRRDRRFGSGGRLVLPGIGVSALRATRCGLLLGGTTHASGSQAQMGLMTIRRDGRLRSPVRKPFGPLRRSTGRSLALLPGLAILGGDLMPYEYGHQFALAGYRTGALLPGC